MKKTLYNIELSYSVSGTNAQLEKLKKYIDVSLKSKDDFGIPSYSDEYKDSSEEERELVQEKEYNEYMKEDIK